MIKDTQGFIYLEIPISYACTYHKLLTYMADYGIDAIKECDSACKGSNKSIIKCWNMFQAAIAAYEIGKKKEANLLINYVDSQLDLIYKKTDFIPELNGVIEPIDENGHVFATLTCRNYIEFYLHVEETNEEFKQGHLYAKILNDSSGTRDFEKITDEQLDLIVKSVYRL
jgi:hypothetical protein